MTLDLSTHEKQAAHYGAIRARFFTGAGEADRLSYADHTVRHFDELGALPKQLPVSKLPPARRDWLFVASDPRDAEHIVTKDAFREPHWRTIVLQTAYEHGVTVQAILSDRRDMDSTAARHDAIARLYRKTSMSVAAIGRRLNRDHTTILHALKKLGVEARQ